MVDSSSHVNFDMGKKIKSDEYFRLQMTSKMAIAVELFSGVIT